MTFFKWGTESAATCPQGPHRGPEGPNEDLAQCHLCWAPSWGMRPEGETFGEHAEDCSLPLRHESYCQPGGSGHPTAEIVRGYFPPRGWADGGTPQ